MQELGSDGSKLQPIYPNPREKQDGRLYFRLHPPRTTYSRADAGEKFGAEQQQREHLSIFFFSK
jgi:hypothetical protein